MPSCASCICLVGSSLQHWLDFFLVPLLHGDFLRFFLFTTSLVSKKKLARNIAFRASVFVCGYLGKGTGEKDTGQPSEKPMV